MKSGNLHRRPLTVVRQSGVSTTCEIAVSRVCGAGRCGSCSMLTAGGLNSAITSDKALAGTTKSVVTFELPVSVIPISVSGPDSISVGDRIDIEAPASMLLALSLVFYLAPAILMLFFAVCCSFFYPESEALAAVSAAGGLGLGLGAIIFSGPVLRTHVTKQLRVHRNL